MNQLIILITGSRDWDDKTLMFNILSEYKDKNVTIIHGNCKGADKCSDLIGKQLSFNIISMPADWKKYGKGAGPIRNKEMINLLLDYRSKEDIISYVLVIAFHDNLNASKGTKHCIGLALREKLPIRYVDHKIKDEDNNNKINKFQPVINESPKLSKLFNS